MKEKTKSNLLVALRKLVEGKDALGQPSKFVGTQTHSLEALGWIEWRSERVPSCQDVGAWWLTDAGKMILAEEK